MSATPEGYPCQRCGHQITVDAVVTHDVWERIKPEGSGQGGGLLCANCMVEALGAKEAWTAVRLVDVVAPAAVAEAVAEERKRWEACLAVAMGGCDANDGLEHSPISLPHDKGYTFCQRCGETLTKAVAKAASSAAVQRAAALRTGETG